MNNEHVYRISINWTGNKGAGTTDYRSYERSHTISADGKTVILASSDPAFRGDRTLYNPEELLVASLSGCHMLWFLHLCAKSGVIVVNYSDMAIGVMEEIQGKGRFREVTLNPVVTVTEPTMIKLLDDLHKKANNLCFIANSVNFTVKHNPTALTIE